MSALASLAAIVLKVFWAVAMAFSRLQAKREGALEQRESDMRAENDRIAKASRAADDVRSGGGVPIESDPNNRDNR